MSTILAEPTRPAAPDAALTTWHFDPSHSELGFAVRHLMISTVKGRFGTFSGTVELDGTDLGTARVKLSIDTASVDTREAKRDAHLRSADFFDADRFPTMTFESTRTEPRGPGHFRLVGDLTIHGITREIALDVTAEGAGRDPWGNDRAGFSATGTINRREFGLSWNQALETGGVVVGEDVKLHLEAQLIQQKA